MNNINFKRYMEKRGKNKKTRACCFLSDFIEMLLKDCLLA